MEVWEYIYQNNVFEKFTNCGLIMPVKNAITSVKNKIISSYLVEDKDKKNKSTNINILLNRVKRDKINERRKKFYSLLQLQLDYYYLVF